MNAAGVSVVICCYNSQDRLSETLRHLALQQLPEGCCLQLVLVDNCCTDATVQLTRKWQQDYGRLISLSVRENLLALVDLIKPLQPVHQHGLFSSSQEG